MRKLTDEEKAEILGLKKQIKAIKDKRKGIDYKELVYPENGTDYWCICGKVWACTWDDKTIDENRYNAGNYYATEEEADLEYEWRELNTRILNTIAILNKEENWVADFNNGEAKWYLSYSEDNGNIENGCCYSKRSHEKNKYFSHNVCIKLLTLTIYTQEQFKFWLTKEK